MNDTERSQLAARLFDTQDEGISTMRMEADGDAGGVIILRGKAESGKVAMDCLLKIFNQWYPEGPVRSESSVIELPLEATRGEPAAALRTLLQGMVADAAAECKQRCTGGFLERGRHSSHCPHGYGEEAAEALALLDALEAEWEG